MSGAPNFINSKKPNPLIPRFSVFWIIILEAAPKIDRLPAMVLPTAKDNKLKLE
ncbi:hypothetical protein SCL14_18015 [Legionella pneumophila serogroup 1]